jgi:predicted CopG family antitoxin
MGTTIELNEDTAEKLVSLKVHRRESYDSVVCRLIATGASLCEADAFKAAEARFEAYLESKREEVREAHRQEIRDSNAANAGKIAEARQKLGLDADEGTVPAWGTKRESNEG